MRLLYLAKVVEEKEYGEGILDGRLFFNRLSHFKRIEENAARRDPDEGSSIYQGDIFTDCTIDGLPFACDRLRSSPVPVLTASAFASVPYLRSRDH